MERMDEARRVRAMRSRRAFLGRIIWPLAIVIIFVVAIFFAKGCGGGGGGSDTPKSENSDSNTDTNNNTENSAPDNSADPPLPNSDNTTPPPDNTDTTPPPDVKTAGLIQLPKTGQTKCYSAAGIEIDCKGTGQDGEIQAGVAWPDPRFIDNGDETVTDKMTGLMWTKDTNEARDTAALPGATTTCNTTWEKALEYVKNMNDEKYQNYSHTDWRLPNIIELMSVVMPFGFKPPSFIDEGGAPWSSTSFNNDKAWVVHHIYHKSSWGCVWPVRTVGEGTVSLPKTGQTLSYYPGDDGGIQAGVLLPNPRFIDNGNGTMMDNLTGLMWTKNANLMKDRDPEFDTDYRLEWPYVENEQDGNVTWERSLEYVKKLNSEAYGGYADWRLPNVNELISLIYYSPQNIIETIDYRFDNRPYLWGGVGWKPTYDAYFSSNYAPSVFLPGIMDKARIVDFTTETRIINAWNKTGHLRVWPVRTVPAK